MQSSNDIIEEEVKVPLLADHKASLNYNHDHRQQSKHNNLVVVHEKNDYITRQLSLGKRVKIESKKLWHIVGPAIFSRVTAYSFFVITQAFAGHLGDLELAAISVAINIIIGFTFGLLLGMASALETLCGQAYGAKRYAMLGVYMQRSWIVLSICCVLLLPLYLFASPVLKLLGQPPEVAELSGKVAMCMIPLHFSLAFQFPLQRFLQSQLKTRVIALVSLAALAVHLFVSWLFVYQLKLGVIGTALSMNFSWWTMTFGLMGYAVRGGCPSTWTGLSGEAFSGLWEFTKLSASSGVMLCLESWYYRILMLMTGNLENAEIALDALAICMTINGWEMMIPLAFFAGTGILAEFEAWGVVSEVLVSGDTVIAEGPSLSGITHASSIRRCRLYIHGLSQVTDYNKVGVAVGSGWQSYVAYINLGCYYLIGVPLGLLMGWGFHHGVMGIWAGMIFGGTTVQTFILAIIIIRCDWEKEAEKANKHVLKWARESK